MSALCPFKHLLSSPKSPPPNVILVPFFTYRHPRALFIHRHPRALFIHRHPRALRGDPVNESRSIPKFLEISEIKDFEDDDAGEYYACFAVVLDAQLAQPVGCATENDDSRKVAKDNAKIT